MGSVGWFAIVIGSVKLSGSCVTVEIERCIMLGSCSYSKFVVVVLVTYYPLVVTVVDYIFGVGPGLFPVWNICFLS